MFSSPSAVFETLHAQHLERMAALPFRRGLALRKNRGNPPDSLCYQLCSMNFS